MNKQSPCSLIAKLRAGGEYLISGTSQALSHRWKSTPASVNLDHGQTPDFGQLTVTSFLPPSSPPPCCPSPLSSVGCSSRAFNHLLSVPVTHSCCELLSSLELKMSLHGDNSLSCSTERTEVRAVQRENELTNGGQDLCFSFCSLTQRT